MELPIVERLRSGKSWLNGGKCCGDVDSDGICAAPACIFGEALKEFHAAADVITALVKALEPFGNVLLLDSDKDFDCRPILVRDIRRARAALQLVKGEKNDRLV